MLEDKAESKAAAKVTEVKVAAAKAETKVTEVKAAAKAETKAAATTATRVVLVSAPPLHGG